MGMKDYEVRNRDYSSGEYHQNGGESHSSNFNQYSRNNDSFLGIIFFIFCFLGLGIYMAFNYGAVSHTEKTDLSASNPQDKKNTPDSYDYSNFVIPDKDNNKKRIILIDNKTYEINKTPLENKKFLHEQCLLEMKEVSEKYKQVEYIKYIKVED